MKQLLTIFIFTILYSCGQPENSNKSNLTKRDDATVDTFGKQTNNLQNKPCNYDNEVASLGIGLIIAPSTFEIFNDSLLTEKIASWDMYEGESKISLCSKFFKPDYGIMHFVCLAKSEKAYKVLVNYSDMMYLPKNKNYDFKTWEEYIAQSFGIRRLTYHNDDITIKHPLRIKPNDKADTLVIPNGQELFCPMEIKGDWIKVNYDCFYNDENNSFEGEPCHNYIDKCKNPLTGWLRWRQENQLLIDIFLMP